MVGWAVMAAHSNGPDEAQGAVGRAEGRDALGQEVFGHRVVERARVDGAPHDARVHPCLHARVQTQETVLRCRTDPSH